MSAYPDTLVGVNYFCGWWRDRPNKYNPSYRQDDWRREYHGRVALLGCYNDQATMDAEILAASDHGVDFFQILWYTPGRHARSEGVSPDRERLNVALDQFVASPENHRMRFCIEFCNHDPFGVTDAAEWESCCQAWIPYLCHPRYLTLNGKKLIKIHGLYQLVQQCDGDLARVNARIARLREIARQCGAGELLVGSGVMPDALPEFDLTALDQLDFLGTYMAVPDLPMRDELYEYETLLQQAKDGWARYADAKKPYLPYLPSGWDPRPWRDQRPSFAFPTRAQWHEALEAVARAIETQPNLHLPDGSKLFTMYAWNEFGEGGIVAPTDGDGYMKLEEIRAVFG